MAKGRGRSRALVALRGLADWTPADKCLLGALIVLPFVVWYAVVVRLLLTHPDYAPYVSRPFLPFVLRVDAILILGWLVIIAAALWLRRRRPDGGLLVHATAQFLALQAVFASYAGGHHTSPLMGILLLAGATFGLLLFERRYALGAIVVFVVGVVGTTAAEQLGWIPYAPALAAPPFADQRLAASWLVGAGAINFVGLLCTVGVIYFAIQRGHEHERELARTADQLARAMELVSRYVAAQVAEQIRLGNYGAVDRHERRKLTIFFSDIKDFSEIADVIEPEDLSRLLNEYLSEMTEIADRYGGTVDKFIGDAIMIFFGAPLANTDQDHAIRAVRMAVDMQARVAALRGRWAREGFDDTFHVRMGINTGVASVGNFGSRGRMDYTAIGRQVNLAARLQAEADPDRILIGHATWVLVREAVPCEPKGEIQVKGLRQPVRAYEVGTAADVERAS
jgi:class 3 adenylate cyclase